MKANSIITIPQVRYLFLKQIIISGSNIASTIGQYLTRRLLFNVLTHSHSEQRRIDMRSLAPILLIICFTSFTQALEIAKLIRRWGCVAVASTSIGISTPQLAFADALPAIGQKAPDFSLPSNAGKDISLGDLATKRTVLYFYPGDFTSGCTIEAKGFESRIKYFDSLDVQVVGVSVDSVDKHLDFKKSYGLDFPLLSDNGGIVSNKYGSLLDLGFIGKFSNRQTFIISKGPEQKIEAVFTDVESRVAKHADDVLDKVKMLPK